MDIHLLYYYFTLARFLIRSAMSSFRIMLSNANSANVTDADAIAFYSKYLLSLLSKDIFLGAQIIVYENISIAQSSLREVMFNSLCVLFLPGHRHYRSCSGSRFLPITCFCPMSTQLMNKLNKKQNHKSNNNNCTEFVVVSRR